ncbi:hypothetical protein [Marinigracilibium pacificum]|uniref:Uncharacterized protein n=1 Tax=Marinigracilibium pacificum TaxID=2729599 RepID=A0A848IXB5_9BACT|nr:hypothetical protein [Marinigracilibium pacificum]NMM47925.1 hypothetical protein [Marinigracilibium pacificum]
MILLVSLFFLIESIRELLSGKPEFEITNKHIIPHNESFFRKIPFSDITGCDIFYIKHSILIGLYLKDDSLIKDNVNKAQRMVMGIPKDKKKVTMISLTVAKIDPSEFKELILERSGLK